MDDASNSIAISTGDDDEIAEEEHTEANVMKNQHHVHDEAEEKRNGEADDGDEEDDEDDEEEEEDDDDEEEGPTPSVTSSTTLSSNNLHSAPSAAAQPPATNTAAGDLERAHRLLKLAKQTIEDLKSQVKAKTKEVEALDQEFSKYRVRSEVGRQQYEGEIARLAEINLKFKQYNVVSNDVMAELEALRKRFLQVEEERDAAGEENARLRNELRDKGVQIQNLTRSVNDLSVSASSYGPGALEELKAEHEAELRRVREEFEAYREKAAHTIHTLSAEIATLNSRASTSMDHAYLRDVVVKYLATPLVDERARFAIEAAIATVLRFTPEEVEYIKRRRNAPSGVTTAASAGIPLAAPGTPSSSDLSSWLGLLGGGARR